MALHAACHISSILEFFHALAFMLGNKGGHAFKILTVRRVILNAGTVMAAFAELLDLSRMTSAAGFRRYHHRNISLGALDTGAALGCHR